MYVIAKRIQWQWPEQSLSGLHIDMAHLSALKDWLDCSDWVATITKSEIAEGGVAGSFLSGFKVSKTRYAHPVSCALEILLKMPYNEEAPTKPFKEWKRNKKTNIPSSNSGH